MPTPPAAATLAGFKAQFDRAFKFGSGTDAVRDKDITQSFVEAASLFNSALFDTVELPVAFYYAAAHFLVLNVQAAGGLSGQNFGLGADNRNGGMVTSKSVGQLSVQYGIPTKIIENPIIGQFMETSFGRKYLQMVAPRLVGNAIAVQGPVDPDVAIPNIPFQSL